MEFISHSEAETFELAKRIAKELSGGTTFALFGDLGSGKTTFTKGLAAALGITEPITSPTFVLMKVYEVNHPAITRLVHVDAYRMADAADAEAIGLLEYFDRDDTVILIEWPERIEPILPTDTQKMYFEYADNNIRKITTDW